MDLEGVFVPSVEGVGEGSRNGETKSRVVDGSGEDKVSPTFLEPCRAQTKEKTRLVWAWRQDFLVMAA